LPPDFSKITESKNYFLPENITATELLLPLPLGESAQQARQRWWNNTFPQTVAGATLETLQMALAGTFLALLVAFPIGFLAARNTTPHPMVYYGVRGALNFVRTIPDLALGLLFVAAVGLGAFAGTIALAIHTATVLGKLVSESVENIDEGIVEAIRATGAGYAQILSFAVLPQVLPDLISFTLYRLETNIRAASVLGLIGAGGIGYLMNTSFRTFQYQEAAAIVLVLIALVMLVDYLSSRLRNLVV
jgi:phosphonate transport system permease protein